MKKYFRFILLIFLFSSAFFTFGIEKGPSDKPLVSKLKKSESFFFAGSLSEALKKAKLENKMVFIDSYTTWCGPCKLMKSMILKDEKLSNYLSENFVCLSVNIEKGEGPRIKSKYPHGTFPTLLFIKNNGKLKNRFVGLPNYGATEILNFAKLATKKY